MKPACLSKRWSPPPVSAPPSEASPWEPSRVTRSPLPRHGPQRVLHLHSRQRHGRLWETALGAVFISGVAFLVLTVLGIRQLVFEAIPPELYAAVAAGIGLFIAVIGLRNSGLIVASPATLVTLGNLHDKNTLVAIAGLMFIAALLAWGVRGAMLIGILATTLLSALCGLTHWSPEAYRISDIAGRPLASSISALPGAWVSPRSSSCFSLSTCSIISGRW